MEYLGGHISYASYRNRFYRIWGSHCLSIRRHSGIFFNHEFCCVTHASFIRIFFSCIQLSGLVKASYLYRPPYLRSRWVKKQFDRFLSVSIVTGHFSTFRFRFYNGHSRLMAFQQNRSLIAPLDYLKIPALCAIIFNSPIRTAELPRNGKCITKTLEFSTSSCHP